MLHAGNFDSTHGQIGKLISTKSLVHDRAIIQNLLEALCKWRFSAGLLHPNPWANFALFLPANQTLELHVSCAYLSIITVTVRWNEKGWCKTNERIPWLTIRLSSLTACDGSANEGQSALKNRARRVHAFDVPKNKKSTNDTECDCSDNDYGNKIHVVAKGS